MGNLNKGFLAVIVLSVLSMSGCVMPQQGTDVYTVSEDVQVDQIKVIKAIAVKLVFEKALKAADRVVLVKLGYFLKDAQAEALMDDALTSGLLMQKVVVLQNADINPLLFRQ